MNNEIYNKIFSWDLLTIERKGNVIKITNHSQYIVILSIVPKKPKIKYRDFSIIQPHSFLIDESCMPIDVFSFRFEKKPEPQETEMPICKS